MNNQEKIEKIIEKVRPFIKMHGGDVEFLEVQGGNTVVLSIKGSCVDCPLANLTYNEMIGGIIKEDVPGITEIILKNNQEK